VEKGERYGEEGIYDREMILTGRVINARTIVPSIYPNIVALVP